MLRSLKYKAALPLDFYTVRLDSVINAALHKKGSASPQNKIFSALNGSHLVLTFTGGNHVIHAVRCAGKLRFCFPVHRRKTDSVFKIGILQL